MGLRGLAFRLHPRPIRSREQLHDICRMDGQLSPYNPLSRVKGPGRRARSGGSRASARSDWAGQRPRNAWPWIVEALADSPAGARKQPITANFSRATPDSSLPASVTGCSRPAPQRAGSAMGHQRFPFQMKKRSRAREIDLISATPGRKFDTGIWSYRMIKPPIAIAATAAP